MINIVELLEKCRVGKTTLYSTILGKCTLESVNMSDPYPIRVKEHDKNRGHSYTKEGKYLDIEGGECVLFPSKTQRDWNKFVPSRIEAGEVVLVSNDAHNWAIRHYSGRNKECYMDKCTVAISWWEYVVPLDEFDFYDLPSNATKSI